MLSVREMKYAQRQYRLFVFFNVISFSLITGNILQLYALRLGAGIGLLSLISSMGSMTFLFSVFGRKFIPLMGAVKVRGYFWLIRYLLMIPMIFLVFPAVRNQRSIVYSIILFGILGFNIFKGMALAADKPIKGWISKES